MTMDLTSHNLPRDHVARYRVSTIGVLDGWTIVRHAHPEEGEKVAKKTIRWGSSDPNKENWTRSTSDPNLLGNEDLKRRRPVLLMTPRQIAVLRSWACIFPLPLTLCGYCNGTGKGLFYGKCPKC